jgi:hypothetical protein
MDLDTDKIDDAALALLLLGTSGDRAWKGFDSATLDRLHERGFISDPNIKGTTLILSAEGLARARRVQAELFGRKA